jgi:hypothetical protein
VILQSGALVVKSFNKVAGDQAGPAERTGCVELGDVLVQVSTGML